MRYAGPGGDRHRWLHEQVLRHLAGLAGPLQLRPVGTELIAQRAFRLWWCRHTELTRDECGLRHVLVAVRTLERMIAVVRVGGEEAVDLGEVHPPEQMGIERRVRPAVGRDALDVLVDAADDPDRALGLGGRTERGRGDEVGRALQPAPRVVPVVAVLGDACHRQWVQRLQQQRPQTADEHRRVGVDATDRRVRTRTTARRVHRTAQPPVRERLEPTTRERTWSANQSRIESLGICPSWHGPWVRSRAVMEEPPSDEPEALVAADGSR